MEGRKIRDVAGAALTIASTIDRRYLQPLVVTVASLVEHLPTGTPVRLFVLHDGLTAADLRHLEAFVHVEAIAPPLDRLAGLPVRRPFTREAYFPLLLPDVLPTALDRVLFLDADLLVLDDLTPLWTVDLEGAPVAAVADGAIPLVSSPRGLAAYRALGIPAAAPYFNAGVMLMDLGAWRREAVTPRAIEFLRSARRVDFLHQEALNAVLWNRWRPLPSRWNVLAGLAGRFDVALPDVPAIAHFAGRFKPWLMAVGGPFGPDYRRALDRWRLSDESSPAPGLGARLAGFYDRRVRKRLYPLERALWNRRLL